MLLNRWSTLASFYRTMILHECRLSLLVLAGGASIDAGLGVWVVWVCCSPRARLKSYRSMGVNPLPLGGYRPPPRLRTSSRPGALSEVLHQHSVPTPPSYPPATTHSRFNLGSSLATNLRNKLIQAALFFSLGILN